MAKDAPDLLPPVESGAPDGLQVISFWDEAQCRSIEAEVSSLRALADAGRFRKDTVDHKCLRSKYFFGHGYTYGAQAGSRGGERILPLGRVDPIPSWIQSQLIDALEEGGLVPKGWINSAVVNDYGAGGVIVGHVDPPHLFARPIFIASFFADCRLAFGAGFAFAAGRFSPAASAAPRYVVGLQRGSLCRMDGFAADGITHGIRPGDVEARRASVVLRHVLADAPCAAPPPTPGPGPAAQSFYPAPRQRCACARQSFYGPAALLRARAEGAGAPAG